MILLLRASRTGVLAPIHSDAKFKNLFKTGPNLFTVLFVKC